ncbi:RIN4 pathogenic type III effector avirulence factor Avr cleavage site [Arabidopsis suecica]|uniref:RIN4 pathogenic type III effector avirulence factor Avr cleavage site n=1 Tax=Arabidopsis suecica TaxID=45249 RepID=A0A8T1Z6P9_ARASU|nr:RIN4 pathogenic type III effector avirulence factor Avr cleavage site [Arabidopsis suecica]
MEDDRKEKNTPWLSVPQFGDWDQKGGGTMPDYSMDFTKIREMRKQNKRDPSRASLGNEEELIKPPESATSTANLTTVQSENQREFSPSHHHQPHSPSTRRSIFSCFNCCVKA